MAPKVTSSSAKAASSSASSSSAKTATAQRSLDEANRKEIIGELLKSLFGFTASSWTDTWVNLTNEHLYRMIEAVETELVAVGIQEAGVRGQEVDEAKVKKEVETGVHKILTVLENVFDHIFDMCEIYFQRNTFSVLPEHLGKITLPYQQGLDLRVAEIDSGRKKAKRVGAQEQSESLYTREKELNAQIRAALAAQHSLRLAQVASSRRLRRQELFRSRFSMLLGSSDDGSQPISSSIAQAARKLRADATTLLDAMDELRALDPLGGALVTSKSTTGEDPPASDDAEGPKAWEQGREGYLNWETDRLVAHAKAEDEGEGGQQSNIASSARKRKSEASADSTSVKHPRPSEATSSRKDFVGEPEILEKLAADLKRQ